MARPSQYEGSFTHNRIKQEHLRTGLSQQEFGAKAKMSVSLISRLKSFKRHAKLDQIDAIAIIVRGQLWHWRSAIMLGYTGVAGTIYTYVS